MKCLLFSILGLVLALGTASAQTITVVSEDFDDGTIGSLQALGSRDVIPGMDMPVPLEEAVANNFNVSGGVANFTGAGDNGRIFIGTSQTDFTATDFTASVDVVVSAGGGANAFFGIGVGDDDLDGSDSFGEPTEGPTAFVSINADNRDGGEVRFADFNFIPDGTVDGDGNSVGNGTSGSPGAETILGTGSHTLIIDFDAETETLTYFASIGTIATGALPGDAGIVQLGITSGGVFTPQVVELDDNGFDATNASIFFGGDDNTTFDNFVVVAPVETTPAIPEPTSAVLFGLGIMGTMVTRRRRA